MSDHTSKITTVSHKQRIIQNFLLIWVDANIDQSSIEYRAVLVQLQNIVNDVNICAKPEECIQLLNALNTEKAFVIASGSLGQHLVPDIHNMPQVDSIYIFCADKARHAEWAQKWEKIQGVHTAVKLICDALQMAVKQCNEDLIAMSFATSDEDALCENIDQVQSFMQAQMLTELLLETKHDKNASKVMIAFCRKLCNSENELKILDTFEHDYRPQSAIWWYTRECFITQMLNRAFRLFEVDIILNMSFFICDVHQQIEELHQKQIKKYKKKPFVVYRGQGLSTTNFTKLKNTIAGLMSFDNFLSTNETREVAVKFAERASVKTDMVGILFEMTINPTVSSTPFATIKEVSYANIEGEILFSIHSVFRIDEITELDEKNLIYQVKLTFTGDDDQQRRKLTERLQKEAGNIKGWTKLGTLLVKNGQVDQAEELYNELLEQTTSRKIEKVTYYNNLACIRSNQGDYKKAIWYYEQELEIRHNALPPNYPSLADSYSTIALLYYKIEEYSTALTFSNKALELRQRNLPPHHPDLALSYRNIGSVYDSMQKYAEALSFYEKAYVIYDKILPTNDPGLAIIYNNLGEAHRNMGEYSKALSFFEKDLQISQNTLPQNHPDLAISYHNIGMAYKDIGEYAKALSYYERALVILQNSPSSTDTIIETVQKNIEIVKNSMN